MKEKVFVALSGGVDSAVTAALLLEKGFDIEGINLRLVPEDDGSSAKDAKAVADTLQIPFHSIDMRKEFSEKVIDYFAGEYMKGRTPNPCIVCNEKIKFGLMLDKVMELGGNYLATGHYARTEICGDKVLLKRANSKKDQSYFLYRLSQSQLKHIMFVMSEFEKADTREIAKKYRLPCAEKADSQEICFIKDNNYIRFLKEYSGYEDVPGNFTDLDGNILGEHKGIVRYTIGQRKGLGIAFGKPMFVTKIIPEKNEVVLAPDGYQLMKEFEIADIISTDPEFVTRIKSESGGNEVLVKIRCQAEPKPARIISEENGRARVVFDEPQRAVTPGQSAVFYEGDTVLGGGFIC